MRLLASTDFALRVLTVLGQAPPGAHFSVETLAERLGGLSRHHLHKIVQDLTAAGVTQTLRGAGGGVRLAQPPEAINLGALIRYLESDQPMVECFRPEAVTCPLLPDCRLRGLIGRAEQDFYARLDRHTLADCLTVPA